MAGGTWGFGATGHGRGCDFGGWGGAGLGGDRSLLGSFSVDADGLLISNGLTTGRQKETESNEQNKRGISCS